MSKQTRAVTDERAKLLPRLTGFFFNRPLRTTFIWLVLLVFGVLSYTTFLKREGFPSISIPLVIVQGSYAVDDPAVVDSKVAAAVSDIALKQAGVSSVSTSSESNFFSATVQYKDGTDTNKAKDDLQKAVEADSAVPDQAKLTFAAPYFGVTGGGIEKIDATISVYSNNKDVGLQQLTDQAARAVKYLNQHKGDLVQNYFVENPFQTVTNPATGQELTVQRTFDRYADHGGSRTEFHKAVTIGVASVSEADVIKLDKQIRDQLDDLHRQSQFNDIQTTITASYAPSINEQISELQRVLLEGLLAVLIVGSIVISLRASLVTVISMVTVITITLGVIYVFGYSLNVITLFALILGLSLIVDDTIIMIEAIDSARRHNTDRAKAVKEASRKIGRAMIAATLTAVLSFAPLLFVNGILGGFIRAIPVTIISALLVSLVVALIFIPLFARFILLGRKHMGEAEGPSAAGRLESKIANTIAKPMLWARHSRKKEFAVGIAAVLIGLLFVGGGVVVFGKVPFNIFPPSKDTNQISVSITYPGNTTITQAEAIADDVDAVTKDALGANLDKASYYGQANNRSATLYIDLIPYGERDATAPDLAKNISDRFKGFEAAKVSATTVDIAPSSSSFTVNINAANRPAAERVAADMVQYLKGHKLTRADGSQATVTEAVIQSADLYQRNDGKSIIAVNATFDGSDVSTLTTLAKKTVSDRYTDAYLQGFGLKASDVSTDIGEEEDFQNSFKALLYAFPLVLLAIYILLLVQFRSFLQPLLIFMALPFSFFGIALGLYFSNNSFSFFAMLGFFALIGLSIKNTILLTDYANQARRAGMPAIDAVVGALGERFRPLVATSLTAVFSLIPLAVTSPFWQSLAIVLIFGLLSSTLLVILVFPYYYLGAEYIRIKIHRFFRRRSQKA